MSLNQALLGDLPASGRALERVRALEQPKVTMPPHNASWRPYARPLKNCKILLDTSKAAEDWERGTGALLVVRKVTAEEQRVKKNANLQNLKTRSRKSARSFSPEQLKRALKETNLFWARWRARLCR